MVKNHECNRKFRQNTNWFNCVSFDRIASHVDIKSMNSYSSTRRDYHSPSLSRTRTNNKYNPPWDNYFYRNVFIKASVPNWFNGRTLLNRWYIQYSCSRIRDLSSNRSIRCVIDAIDSILKRSYVISDIIILKRS